MPAPWLASLPRCTPQSGPVDVMRIDLLTAPNAEIGVELIRARRPSAVILDINTFGGRLEHGIDDDALAIDLHLVAAFGGADGEHAGRRLAGGAVLARPVQLHHGLPQRESSRLDDLLEGQDDVEVGVAAQAP